ncbi:NADP-dependent oxidoreductase [Psychromicrobium xiongbiense]|uniref:NADP-dependent oxidoreductase n=1 Tax=Psychromicrobium xiongbiense TaxID=3051184 RepID=UPI002556C811|nr:NADP-dependent oxidoreductase [Psychromicrobium sp. YIM S02556]
MMSRFVHYTEFGGPEVLQVIDVPEPVAGPGEIRIRTAYAAINPVDYKIFAGGPAAAAFGAVLPSGVGNDLSGIVDQVGEGVTDFSVGQKVYAGARNRAVADCVVVPSEFARAVPEGLGLDLASGLWVVGRTATALVNALNLTADDTVLVGAAAGGVGVLAVQLARRTGATVMGTASEANHDYLRSLGAIPVSYGEGVIDQVRAVAPQGITAVIDANGPDTIELALALGVSPERIVSAATYGNALRGARAVGGAQANNADLVDLAQLVAEGEIQLPIDSRYPLAEVREAYAHAKGGHLRGKILIELDSDL